LGKPQLEKGLVQVYTGDGKGKTTAPKVSSVHRQHRFRSRIIRWLRPRVSMYVYCIMGCSLLHTSVASRNTLWTTIVCIHISAAISTRCRPYNSNSRNSQTILRSKTTI